MHRDGLLPRRFGFLTEMTVFIMRGMFNQILPPGVPYIYAQAL